MRKWGGARRGAAGPCFRRRSQHTSEKLGEAGSLITGERSCLAGDAAGRSFEGIERGRSIATGGSA